MAIALIREDTSRVLYPDMSEADRAVAYEQLLSLVLRQGLIKQPVRF